MHVLTRISLPSGPLRAKSPPPPGPPPTPEGCSAGADATPAGGFDCASAVAEGVRISWALAADGDSVRLRLDATVGASYVALGAGGGASGAKMLGSDIAVGYVGDSGGPVIKTYRLPQYSAPSETDDACGGGGDSCPLSELAVAAPSGGVLAVELRLALSGSMDDDDVRLVWAVGNPDREWPAMHADFGAYAIGGGAVALRSRKAAQFTHGALMLAAWAGAAPAAALVARAVRWGALANGKWFQAHLALVAAASAATLWAFFLAVRRFHTPAGVAHAKIGVAVFAIFVVQVLMGVLRPGKNGEPKRLGVVPPGWRPAFQAAHRGVGALALALGAAACITGGMRYEALWGASGLLVAAILLLGAWTAAWLFAEVQRWPAEGHCTIASNATEMAMRSGDSARSGAQLIDMPR